MQLTDKIPTPTNDFTGHPTNGFTSHPTNGFTSHFPWLSIPGLTLKRTPLIGLDISSSAVKLLAFSSHQKISHYGLEALPPDAVLEGTVRSPDAVIKAIENVVRKSGTSEKNVCISVSGSTVMSKVVQMGADFDDQEISDQLNLEPERYFPFPIEEVYYDFEVLGPSSKNPELIDVLLGAAKIETVDAKVNLVKEAGLRPTMVDIDAIAMERAYGLVSKHLSAEDRKGKIGLIDIGATITTFYVFQGPLLIYSREQVFGGKQIVDEIERRYSLSLEEALAQMKFGQLPEDYTQEVLLPFRNNVVAHIDRAIQTYIASSDDPEIKYFLLAGGVSELPGLESQIHSTLNLRTMIANPFLDLEVDPRVNKNALTEEAPSLMVAAGLALRTFEE